MAWEDRLSEFLRREDRSSKVESHPSNMKFLQIYGKQYLQVVSTFAIRAQKEAF